MKKIYSQILLGTSLLMVGSIMGQTRYLDNITEDVQITTNIEYGTNIGIITQAPALESLQMDVYEPANDTVSSRPVVLMIHTGSFLPPVFNGQPTGDKSDNAIVEMCKRFAKKGYVAVALNHRLGWNPVSPSEDVRRSTLIQAAYRGLQDVKTAVRFLRKSAAESGNPYGVGDKFAVGGNGTGGYISLSLATLNDYNSELLMPKFIDTSDPANPIPYIIPSIFGNFEATDFGMLPVDTTGDGIPDMEVPFCVPNHVGYSSEVDMVFNAGGALPEISWLEAGEVPMASFQCVNDPLAPYGVGNVIVPTTGEFVIEAMGSKIVQEAATTYGNNDVFEGLSTIFIDNWYGTNSDIAANAATAGHDSYFGLFPVITPAPATNPTPCGFLAEQGAPWDWWDNAAYDQIASVIQGQAPGVMGCLAILDNPDMSVEKGMAFADLMSDFFTPRVYAALNADGNIETGVGTEELNELSLSIYPIPATHSINIKSDAQQLKSVELIDLTGKVIESITNINAHQVTIEKNNLNSGLYLLKIIDENEASSVRRVIFK